MTNDASDVLSAVGENLRRVRNRVGLSQSELAVRSGVSRRTVINIEAGEANISLSGLDRLAEALNTTFVELVSPASTPSNAINAVTWRGASADSVAVLLGVAPAHQEAQLWSWSLAKGERYEAEPDPAGWREMIFVTEGSLLIERDEGPVRLGPEGHAIYSTTQNYSYLNTFDGVTKFVRNVIS